jgi:hypothetical protein
LSTSRLAIMSALSACTTRGILPCGANYLVPGLTRIWMTYRNDVAEPPPKIAFALPKK